MHAFNWSHTLLNWLKKSTLIFIKLNLFHFFSLGLLFSLWVFHLMFAMKRQFFWRSFEFDHLRLNQYFFVLNYSCSFFFFLWLFIYRLLLLWSRFDLKLKFLFWTWFSLNSFSWWGVIDNYSLDDGTFCLVNRWFRFSKNRSALY